MIKEKQHLNDKNKSKNEVIAFIPMQIYRKTQLLKTKGLQPTLGVTCCTQSIYPKHNLEAGITFSLCTFSVQLCKFSLKTMRFFGI